MRGQLFNEGIDAPAGVVVGRLAIGVGLVEPGHGHDDDRLVHVVEDHHLIVEGKRQIGHLAIVLWGIGQVLDVADDVVAGVAHGAAAKGGQLGERGRAVGLDAPAKLIQRIFRLDLPRDEDRHARSRDAGVRADRHPLVVGFNFQEGVRGQEAVAPDLLSAHDALEKARTAPGIELMKGGDGRQRIANQPAIDGDQVGAVGKLAESRIIWIIGNVWCLHAERGLAGRKRFRGD